MIKSVFGLGKGSVFMTAVKNHRKKLCDAGTASCLFAFIALLASGAGTALEFIGREIYRREFGGAQMLFSKEWDEYFTTYRDSIVLFAISLTVFFICLANRRKKKLGAEFGAVVTVLSAVMSAAPAIYIYRLMNDTAFRLASDSSDEANFMYIMQALLFGLPLAAGIFLFLCGITLWGRNATDDFSVMCPCMKYMPVSENVSSDEPVIERKEKPEEVTPSFEFENSNYMGPDDSAGSDTMAVIKQAARCCGCGAELKDGAKFCQRCGERII